MKFLIALLFPLTSLANEAQLGCNLERDKAEVSASILAAPQAVAQVGQDAATGQKSVIAGISQSLSGRVRAGLTREAAEARCDALRSTVLIETYGRSAVITVQRGAARVELKSIEKAIDLAKTHIAQLDNQLIAQVITINQHTQARQTLLELETKQAALMRVLAKVVEPTEPIINLLDSARVAEGRAAQYLAESTAASGWDVKVAAGARQPFDGGSAQPYANITFTYSFGYSASKEAAARVGHSTEVYLASQGSGYTQTVLRQQKELAQLYDTEVLTATQTARERVALQKVRASLVGLNTVLALNTLQELDIQLLALIAQEQGAEARAAGYKKLVQELK
jgi:hypothetical protein